MSLTLVSLLTSALRRAQNIPIKSAKVSPTRTKTGSRTIGTDMKIPRIDRAPPAIAATRAHDNKAIVA
jgi:hypothetical protein